MEKLHQGLYWQRCLFCRYKIQVWSLKWGIWGGNNLLSMHCYIQRQSLASKEREKRKKAPDLNDVLPQSTKIINYKKNSV
jgi:hypothetical protein